MFPILQEFIKDSNEVSFKYRVIIDNITKIRHIDYYSELLILSENLSILIRPDSNIFQKINLLRTIKTTLLSKNFHKINAAFDLKFPQFIIHFLQDDDNKTRSEVLDIFYEISKGCIQKTIPKLPKLYKNNNFQKIFNYFIVNFSDFKETKGKNCEIPSKKLKILAFCFANPLFIFPIVRILKMKTESTENKEIAYKILINILQGSPKCQQACLSPITDTLSSLCNFLLSFAKTSDSKTGKMLGPIYKDLLETLLLNSNSNLIKCFRLTPGADVLIKELNFRVPEIVT